MSDRDLIFLLVGTIIGSLVTMLAYFLVGSRLKWKDIKRYLLERLK